MCACVQVHTFYEAVGLMINAQTETATQERLIEKYMQLPNQIWDNIIAQATQASHSLHTVDKQPSALCSIMFEVSQSVHY